MSFLCSYCLHQSANQTQIYLGKDAFLSNFLLLGGLGGGGGGRLRNNENRACSANLVVWPTALVAH